MNIESLRSDFTVSAPTMPSPTAWPYQKNQDFVLVVKTFLVGCMIEAWQSFAKQLHDQATRNALEDRQRTERAGEVKRQQHVAIIRVPSVAQAHASTPNNPFKTHFFA